MLKFENLKMIICNLEKIKVKNENLDIVKLRMHSPQFQIYKVDALENENWKV